MPSFPQTNWGVQGYLHLLSQGFLAQYSMLLLKAVLPARGAASRLQLSPAHRTALRWPCRVSKGLQSWRSSSQSSAFHSRSGLPFPNNTQGTSNPCSSGSKKRLSRSARVVGGVCRTVHWCTYKLNQVTLLLVGSWSPPSAEPQRSLPAFCSHLSSSG